MEDTELPRYRLKQNRLNPVMSRGEQVLATSEAKGVYPFFRALPDNGSGLHAAGVARLNSGALPPAMLFVYAQRAWLHASLTGMGELATLRSGGKCSQRGNAVPHVLNVDGTDI